jgi:serine/threonine protein kinase
MDAAEGNKLNLPQVMLYNGDVIELPDKIQIKVGIVGGDKPKNKIKCQMCSKAYAPEINYAVEVCNECMAKIVLEQQNALEGQRKAFEDIVAELVNQDAPIYVELPKGYSPPNGYSTPKELGRGGMGVTHLIKDKSTGQHIVMKTILAEEFDEDIYDSPERRESAKKDFDKRRERRKKQFEREMYSMMKLSHQNIVKLIDYGTTDTGHYILLEYCDGGDLSYYIRNNFFKNNYAVDLDTAINVTSAILDGLNYMHGAEVIGYRKDGSVEKYKGLVHRDIKPGNIFLTEGNGGYITKIGDFGLAKAHAITNTKAFTETSGGGSGTFVFMCRQQYLECKYSNPTLPEVDIWAAAAILYYMLTAKFPRPFTGEKDPAEEFLALKVDSIAKHRRDLPAKLIAVIDGALDDSKARLKYQNAAEFKKALKEAINNG